MEIGDLVLFDEEFYSSMKKAGIPLLKVAIVIEKKDLFCCVRSGDVDDLWVTPPDIKKINLDKCL